MNKYSIILVTHKRPLLLQRCLQSILPHQNKEAFDIYVVLNGDDNETNLLIKNSFPTVTLINTKKVNPGEARNLAITQVSSEYCFFLDDDTILPFDYFEQVNSVLDQHSDLEIFGGPDANYPNSGSWEKALSVALTSPLATAGTRFRHSSGEENSAAGEEKLILCNMWVKNSLFKDGLRFDKRFFRNEENVLIFQAKEKGAKVHYFPKLFVYHKRKSSVMGLFRAVLLSGSGRLRSFILYPKSLNPIYFVPFLFSTYILALVLCDLSGFKKLPLIIYVVINFFLSWKLSKNKRNSLFLVRVSFIQFIINFAYGLGFYLEFFNRLIALVKKPQP